MKSHQFNINYFLVGESRSLGPGYRKTGFVLSYLQPAVRWFHALFGMVFYCTLD